VGLWKLFTREQPSLIEGSTKAAIRELELRIEATESRFRTLELEWTDTHAKIRRALGRIDKTTALDKSNIDEFPSEEKPLTRDEVLRRARGLRNH
jgi:hypothetical protein